MNMGHRESTYGSDLERNNHKTGTALYTLMLNFFTQMPHDLSAQFVCPSSKVLDFNEKRLHWTSVVGASMRSEVCKSVPSLTAFLLSI